MANGWAELAVIECLETSDAPAEQELKTLRALDPDRIYLG